MTAARSMTGRFFSRFAPTSANAASTSAAVPAGIVVNGLPVKTSSIVLVGRAATSLIAARLQSDQKPQPRVQAYRHLFRRNAGVLGLKYRPAIGDQSILDRCRVSPLVQVASAAGCEARPLHAAAPTPWLNGIHSSQGLPESRDAQAAQPIASGSP